MKKLQKISALLFVCVLMFVVTPGLFAEAGTIRQLTGAVELRHSGSAVFVPASAGDRVAADTVISTGLRSSALVEIGGAMITVRPLTRLTLTELRSAAGTETINVALQTGRVRVDLNPPAGSRASMAVRGPTATASVRGTSFEFDTRTLAVHHGQVAYGGSRGGAVLVNAGSSSRITDTGRASDPTETALAALFPAAPAGIVSGHNIAGTASGANFNIVITNGDTDPH